MNSQTSGVIENCGYVIGEGLEDYPENRIYLYDANLEGADETVIHPQALHYVRKAKQVKCSICGKTIANAASASKERWIPSYSSNIPGTIINEPACPVCIQAANQLKILLYDVKKLKEQIDIGDFS